MKPASFEYHSPETVTDVLTLFDEHEDSELMAGNQSLGIVMANRLSTPEHIIDLNGVDELAFVEAAGDTVEIGAMTRHRTIKRSSLLVERLPILPEAAGEIAGPSVRSRGTIGGSIGEADPAANYPTVLAALNGTLHLQSCDGTREIPVNEYFIAYMFTELRENEIIERVSVSTDEFPADRTGMAFVELKRTAQTWPTLSAASVVRVDDPTVAEPIVEEARVALGNAADVPLRVEAAEEAVEKEPLTDETLSDAATAAETAADPSGEMHADEEYKVKMAGEYARRALETATDRATSAERPPTPSTNTTDNT